MLKSAGICKPEGEPVILKSAPGRLENWEDLVVHFGAKEPRSRGSSIRRLLKKPEKDAPYKVKSVT